MKRQYDKQEITRILGKFMTGETSLEEEQMLAQYFRTHEVDDEWQEYKEMFALFDNGEVDIEADDGSNQAFDDDNADDGSNQAFDDDNEKVKILPKAVNEKPKIIPIWWLTAGIAASVLLLLALHYKGNDVKPEKQPVVAQHTEQQDSTIKTEERHQIQEAPVVVQSTLVKRMRKAKTTTVSTSRPKVASSVPQTYVAQTVKMDVDDPAEQMESEFKAQTASVRQRGEQVMLNVASLSQQEIDNYQMIEF